MTDAIVPGSVRDEDRPLIPIRMVNSLLYCPREAWYQFTLGEDPVNLHMERGLRRHDTFGQADPPETEGHVYRHLPVYAPRLGVQGVVDEVVIGADELTVTEYKSARVPSHVWEGIAAQVVVQALALREHAATDRWRGPPLPDGTQLRVYFTDSRRYREVPFTAETERRAREAIDRAQAILTLPTPPPGNVGPRCEQCQHAPACLPFDVPIWIAAGEEWNAGLKGRGGR